MEIVTLLLVLVVCAETTFLTVRQLREAPVRGGGRRKVYVDTCALMDPRVLEVAQTGFIGDDICVPRSVTHELQLLADGKDPEKRARARAGLDAVRELERVVYFNTTIVDDPLDRTPVDDRLIELAKANRGLILTNDFNLQKVAETEGIDVLNVNELALVLRNKFLPGERATVRIVATGNNPNQGVGYLSDGTMVIVDNAATRRGQELDIEFVRLNQTASGTVMFARIVQGPKKVTKRRKIRLPAASLGD